MTSDTRRKKARTPAPQPSKKPLLENLENANADQLLTIDQVRQFLNISDWLVRQLIKRRELRGVKIAGMTRIRLADLREFIVALPPVIEPVRGKRGQSGKLKGTKVWVSHDANTPHPQANLLR